MSPAVQGSLLGLLLGTGLLVTGRRLHAVRHVDLDARLAPYLRDAARPSRLLGRGATATVPLLRRVLRPLVSDAARRVDHLMGGSASVRRRLERAGREPDLEAFRAEQVLWGAAGLAAGCVVAALSWWRGTGSAPALAALALIAGAGGVAGRDWALSQQALRREKRILAQFPTVAEMLALSVSAGEGPAAALDRVARLSDGDLAVELRRTVADARAGASLTGALQSLADRTALVPVARFVDGVVVAVERGTPLAEVLRAQAQDVRDAGQRSLMETAGKKEIAMMVPVVKRYRY